MARLVLAGCLTSVAVASENGPLGKVLSLMDDLAAKIHKEGDVEEQAFQKYVDWCDDVSKNTKFEINTAAKAKEKLEAKIVDLAANIETAESKIGDIATEISSSESDLAGATAVRKKEEADFLASEEELVESIDMLARAITVIDREMRKNPSFAQFTGGISNLLKSMSTIIDAAGFSSSDQQRLSALVQSQEESDDDELGAPAAAVYKSHSSNIIDTLEDLKEKADIQLADLRKAEVNAKHSYEMLEQSLKDQLAADNQDLSGEKNSKFAAEGSKATAQKDLSVTTAELKASKEDLDTATHNCAQVASDHEVSVKAREEELKVIAEAKQALADSISGAASLFQLDAVAGSGLGIRTRSDLVRSEIVTVVKQLAKREHSVALAQLASRIATVLRYGVAAGEDPFAKVKVMIQDMLSKLEEQGSSEANEKAYCDEEMAKSEAKKSELDAGIAKLSTKIDQVSSRSVELKDEVAELQGELASLAKEQADMDTLRQEAHANYVAAKAELELALSGVRKAIDLLREYYGGNAAFVQAPAAPAPHKSAVGAGQSIIGLLEVCESDFAKSLANEEMEESSRATAYEKNTMQNKLMKTQMAQDVKYKTKEHVSLDKSLAELSSDRETASTELSAVTEYNGKLKGRCIARPETYEQRKQRREAELAGLKEALVILENEVALVQHGKRSRRMRGSLMF